MLCQRYGNPAFFIDQMLETEQFYEFCIDVVKAFNKERKEAREWEVWLHKVYDKTWSDFIKPQQTESIDKEQVAQQIRDIHEMATSTNWNVG